MSDKRCLIFSVSTPPTLHGTLLFAKSGKPNLTQNEPDFLPWGFGIGM